jgi:hypothetical protein
VKYALEITSTAAKLRIHSKRPSFTVTNTPAKLSIERQAPAFRRPEPGAFAPMPQTPEFNGDVVQLSKRFEGYNSGTEVVNRFAGMYAAQSEQEQERGVQEQGVRNQGAMTAIRRQQRQAVAKNEASRREEDYEWDPGYVKMSWEAHSIELKWDVHPLEVEYEPYSIEISMKEYPSVRIRAHAAHTLGRRVDRRV